MTIVAQTPNRVDLAGGTLDIYPLYLFEEGSVTVNIAIQIYSRAEIDARKDYRIHLFSKDLGKETSFSSIDGCIPEGDLGLVVRAVKHYAPPSGLTLSTHNEAPQGSGIGASSALLMAVSGALARFNSMELTIQEIVDAGANLEAQAIRIPTGKQDYLAAMHGGINAIWFDEKGARREPIVFSETEIRELEARLILSYTGIPHFSGENNWTIVRRYIDGELSTVNALRRIKMTAMKMRDAVLDRQWSRIGELLAEEWENRKALASGVTTDVIEHLMAVARQSGAVASKLCGAGGGGCMITWVEPSEKKIVEETLAREGGRILPFKIALTGIQITEKISSASSQPGP